MSLDAVDAVIGRRSSFGTGADRPWSWKTLGVTIFERLHSHLVAVRSAALVATRGRYGSNVTSSVIPRCRVPSACHSATRVLLGTNVPGLLSSGRTQRVLSVEVQHALGTCQMYECTIQKFCNDSATTSARLT